MKTKWQKNAEQAVRAGVFKGQERSPSLPPLWRRPPWGPHYLLPREWGARCQGFPALKTSQDPREGWTGGRWVAGLCCKQGRQSLAGERGMKPNPSPRCPAKDKGWHGHWWQQGKCQWYVTKWNFPHEGGEALKLFAQKGGGSLEMSKIRLVFVIPVFCTKWGTWGAPRSFALHLHLAVLDRDVV